MKESLRDKWVLLIILLTTPFFIFLYWLFTMDGTPVYNVAALNQDKGLAADFVITEIESMSWNSGKHVFAITKTDSREEARDLLKRNSAVILIEFPDDFSECLMNPENSRKTEIIVEGDVSSQDYITASVFLWDGMRKYLEQFYDDLLPITIREVPAGISSSIDEFDIYVPGLLVLAVLMLLYSAAIMTANEIEHNAIAALRVSPVTSFSMTAGISLAQLVTAAASLGLSFITAKLLGFHSNGSLFLALIVCLGTGLFCVGLGIIIGCIARAVSRSFVIATVPFLFMMFFSGAVYPVPKLQLFHIDERAVFLFDFLPATHAVNALNGIFIHGASIGDIAYELVFILILSVLVYIAGISLFRRKYFPSGRAK